MTTGLGRRGAQGIIAPSRNTPDSAGAPLGAGRQPVSCPAGRRQDKGAWRVQAGSVRYVDGDVIFTDLDLLGWTRREWLLVAHGMCRRTGRIGGASCAWTTSPLPQVSPPETRISCSGLSELGRSSRGFW